MPPGDSAHYDPEEPSTGRFRAVSAGPYQGLIWETGPQRLTPNVQSPPTPQATRWDRLLAGGLAIGDETPEPVPPPEHPEGSFAWATAEMRRGNKVARKAWPSRSMLWVSTSYRTSGPLERLCFRDPAGDTMTGIGVTLDVIEGADWIVVEGHR